jgi:hypothetical protein
MMNNNDEKEKERKKKSAQRVFDRYKRYKDGPAGSPDQWARQAENVLKPVAGGNLALLGLSEMPETIKELKAARRKAMLANHPDRGGDETKAAAINRAYDQLAKHFDKS